MQHAPTARVFSPQRLKEAAKEARLTQQQIAFRLGMSVAGVQNWYLGRTSPNGLALIALAEMLDREPSWFYVPELEEAA